MPKRKPSAEIEQGWVGFPERLKFAISTRRREWGWGQNEFAKRANYDAPNLSRLLGKVPRGWEGLTANTVLAFARCLQVRPAWLLTGEEPSGLAEHLPSDRPSRAAPVVDDQGLERKTQKLFKAPRPNVPDRAGE